METRINELISEQNSNYGEKLKQVIFFAHDLLQQEEILPDELQWQIFINHVDAMIFRSVTGETLPEMDEELFAELSKESIELALKIMEQVENLQQNERFLLALHIENARGNIN
ncbi:PRD domain protein EF_0829/AHA_3910 [Pilibacter termitis]|uniref:PRD domain protein EF_0829/AHA_3910 n=1 Tax=Pilibacter termitis TaxID=263852 RepID=A0A1T4NXY6_9ENTE|nr:PRD domain-containing protein [Pilibacter termitis]SJZ84065.1 PRD domain protein EF_0829/AHA_3910 [Pilibacter termitis]